jgi:hypothetical protein
VPSANISSHRCKTGFVVEFKRKASTIQGKAVAPGGPVSFSVSRGDDLCSVKCTFFSGRTHFRRQREVPMDSRRYALKQKIGFLDSYEEIGMIGVAIRFTGCV